MTTPSRAPRRLRIDRLELDVRGIAPDTAEAVAREVGVALARALRGSGAPPRAASRLDAGRITSPPAPAPRELATRIAHRVAARVRESRP